jgi:hypothetical protein
MLVKLKYKYCNEDREYDVYRPFELSDGYSDQPIPEMMGLIDSETRLAESRGGSPGNRYTDFYLEKVSAFHNAFYPL